MTYGYYQPQQQHFQQNFMKVLSVTTKDQAKNTPVDFNGMPTFFYNQNANEVYSKQFDVSTGSAIWKEFSATEPVKEEQPHYLDVETYKTDYSALNEKIDALVSQLEERSKK